MADAPGKPRPRSAEATRRTAETDIDVKLSLEGAKRILVDTPNDFLRHMIHSFAFHGGFGLEMRALAEVDLGGHHLVEDAGACLGEALLKSLGSGKAIQRFGSATIPMDEALVCVALDISGRGSAHFTSLHAGRDSMHDQAWGFERGLVEEFFKAFCRESKTTLHVVVLRGGNPHHVSEAAFKAFGRALRQAVALTDEDVVRSTKGVLI